MDIDTTIILISIIILLAIIRPFTVFIHEIGHGLPALLLTKDRVKLFIGFHEEMQKGLHLHLGRLEVYFQYNPFLSKLGYCVPESVEISKIRNIVIILCGPIISLLLGILSIYISFGGNLHASLKFISILILASSLFDFFVSMIPDRQPALLPNGLLIYNDGQQLLQLIKYQVLPNQINMGIYSYQRGEFLESYQIFRNILERGIKHVYFYRLALSSLLFCKEYNKAQDLINTYQNDFVLNADDFGLLGLFKSKLGRYQEGLLDFNQSLELDPNNKYSLVNRGYTHLIMGNYQMAIDDFNTAVEMKVELAYAYCNRGLARIKMGDEKNGLDDINRSLKLDSSNSYAYRNLGIYYFDKLDFERARLLFKRAYELDGDTHLIREYIQKTDTEIQNIKNSLKIDDSQMYLGNIAQKAMEEVDFEKIELEIIAISSDLSQRDKYTLVLGRSDLDRELRIIIGGFEAQAMVAEREMMQTRLPLGHRFSFQGFKQMGYTISEAIINNLLDGVFVGRLTLDNNIHRLQMECRVSDMIIFALISKVPIYCDKFVFDMTSVKVQNDGLSKEEKVGFWKKFLRL